MNIRDYWPLSSPETSTPSLWEGLLSLRLGTFEGFLKVEAQNGFLQSKVSLATSQGQEMVRILCFRILEELSEAYASTDQDHYYEELIDAFNYLTGLFCLSGAVSPTLHLQLHILTGEIKWSQTPERLSLLHLGRITLLMGDTLGDLLRNRAWMQQAQNTYFDGDLYKILRPVFHRILSSFPDFSTFWNYWMAKDAVLQFRLRSRY